MTINARMKNGERQPEIPSYRIEYSELHLIYAL